MESEQEHVLLQAAAAALAQVQQLQQSVSHLEQTVTAATSELTAEQQKCLELETTLAAVQKELEAEKQRDGQVRVVQAPHQQPLADRGRVGNADALPSPPAEASTAPAPALHQLQRENEELSRENSALLTKLFKSRNNVQVFCRIRPHTNPDAARTFDAVYAATLAAERAGAAGPGSEEGEVHTALSAGASSSLDLLSGAHVPDPFASTVVAAAAAAGTGPALSSAASVTGSVATVGTGAGNPASVVSAVSSGTNNSRPGSRRSSSSGTSGMPSSLSALNAATLAAAQAALALPETVVEALSETELACFDKGRRSWRPFAFDRVLPPHASQQDVFREVEPLAMAVLAGYNACVFAYGISGSGKSHSMMGPSSDPGITARMLSKLFSLVQDIQKQGQQAQAQMQAQVQGHAQWAAASPDRKSVV